MYVMYVSVLDVVYGNWANCNVAGKSDLRDANINSWIRWKVTMIWLLNEDKGRFSDAIWPSHLIVLIFFCNMFIVQKFLPFTIENFNIVFEIIKTFCVE